MADYDLVIGGGDVVLPTGVVAYDVGVKDGVVTAIERGLGKARATRYIDARNKVVLPGSVDAHVHIGIYRPMAEDAVSESTSALHGGVTTLLSYFRTGQHYLNMSDSYKKIFPMVLEACRGNFLTDYAFHIAPMLHMHVDEIDEMFNHYGISTFKFYTFYKMFNLAASGSSKGYIGSDDAYDNGHLFRVMQKIAGLSQAYGRAVRLSVHCEDPEIIRTFLPEAKKGDYTPLGAYSAARPPLAEVMAITNVGLLAAKTGCPVNFLHLSSKEAVVTASMLRRDLEGLDASLEVTLHHLALDNSSGDGVLAKVNPPVRTKADNQALWEAVENGTIDIVCSDHACCTSDKKGTDVWNANPGFGGTALMVPMMITEAHIKRSIPLTNVAKLIATNPARYHGLYPKKGVIAPGSDADLTVVDMGTERAVTAGALHSAQDFTPFDGMRLKGWPTHVTVRGQAALEDGKVVAKPGIGQFLRRPASSRQSQF